MILRIPLGSLDVGHEIYNAIRRSRGDLSWAIVLPGLWGANAVRQRMADDGDILVIDGSLATGRAGSAMGAALSAAGSLAQSMDGFSTNSHLTPEQLNDSLLHWIANRTGRKDDSALPIVCIESPQRLDEASTQILENFVFAKRLRLMTIVTTLGALPGYVVRQWRVGNLQVLRTPLVTSRDLERALRRRLGGEVSPWVLQRMSALGDRNAGLADLVLDAARKSEVLHFDGGKWRWSADESAFLAELARIGEHVLTGFSDSEKALLILTAVCGSIPAQWAEQRYGEDAVRSLAAQRLLGAETSGAQGYLDLRISAESLRSILLAGVGEVEKVRLWHVEGRRLLAAKGGPASHAAVTHWQAMTEGSIAAQEAYRASQYAITRGWYQIVVDFSIRLREPSPEVQLLAARSYLALGHVMKALKIICRHVLDPLETGETADREVLRAATVLTERAALFHPHLAEPVLHRLRSAVSESLTPDLDETRWSLAQNENPPHAQELALLRPRRHDEECILSRLWLGARLGMRVSPDIGRLVLASLLDDLAREGGYPDIEESAVALLLMITSIQGWRTDVLKIDMHLRQEDSERGPALPAVADAISTVTAMQEDRMEEAYHCAISATRTFEHTDPFGLYAFASSLAVATSSYVDDELAARERARHREQCGRHRGDSGPDSLRLITQGMTMIGSGQSRPEINAQLIDLADTARDEGEWAQQQQLLLLALLGGSSQAGHAVLTAPWHSYPGRAGMIGMLAGALAVSPPEEAVETAEVLMGAGSVFFGLTVLIKLWSQRESLPRDLRARIIRNFQAVQQREGEGSWLLRNETKIGLDSRETETLRLLDAGNSSLEIARTLHLSQRTVESTISGLCQRFACANRVELLALGLLDGHIP